MEIAADGANGSGIIAVRADEVQGVETDFGQTDFGQIDFGPPGLHTTAREPKRAHLRVPAFNHHQNSKRRPPEREEKNAFCGGRGKNSAKFWAVQGKGGPGGTEHDQTKTFTPTPTRETPHHETV